MGYGQSWLFRYPAPALLPSAPVAEPPKTSTPKRSSLRRPSSGDIEPIETTSLQDRDVGAFSLQPIAADRLLVTTPWAICDLRFQHETQTFQLSPLGDAAAMDDVDRAMLMAGTPPDASFLYSDILHLSATERVLLLVYQELHGKCCVVLQPVGKTASSKTRQRLEQTDVPLKTVPMAVEVGNASFHGALLFRHDAIVAVGYTSGANAAIELDADDFATFFPHLVGFGHAVTAYHSVRLDDTRIIALGCGNGVVHFMQGPACLDSIGTDFVATTFEIDGPVSDINVCSPRRTDDSTGVTCMALVSGSIGYAVVYANPFDASASPSLLPDSDYYDSILCCASADVDFDGDMELLLGSFSNALVAYKSTTSRDGGRSWRLEPRTKWDFFSLAPSTRLWSKT
ncbi:hypothetical protein SPRG_02750 [Saprolegnia parasitica CBS 223.65]|uniref:Cleavage/polyadenylation specificity factor A subunit N-terminal domain-containing protein n=1 Tax=Saprolegnia parasitica (strain CBS 223.65) TaxID=695850 RepID=A0A067D0J2_SAPPC|nr:hypothetical protein SPRG_02750 [Saprolegnia parasitica CBS 223.65]KDO32271.1 hypothetical protein SPRG_02750 [Saprolegnia parasitica CBS 223.65]|eukprot:XP_012196727.1 hypothetical protein SPRG_02750 [Saprolegnia parasitica CBS 223.65]